MSELSLHNSHINSPMVIASPLANSTRIQTNISNNNTNIVINNYNFNQIVINESKKSSKSQKSISVSKKPVVSRKAIAPKKTGSDITINKSSGNAKKVHSVERILNQINMSKYSNLFRNCDINKFKELRELDLNAMGITRPQEIRIFKEAIYKVKTEHINTVV